MIPDHETLMIESQMDIYSILANQLGPHERIAAVRTIVSNIDEPGVIEKIRDIVNDPNLDD